MYNAVRCHDTLARGGGICARIRHGRGGFRKDYTDAMQPPRQAEPATPPQEGNYGLHKFDGASG